MCSNVVPLRKPAEPMSSTAYDLLVSVALQIHKAGRLPTNQEASDMIRVLEMLRSKAS